MAPTAIAFLDTRLIGDRYLNHILVGDITTGTLYHFTPNANRDGFAFVNPGLGDLVADPGDEAQELIFGGGFGGISDVKVGPDGRVYVLSFGLGKIFAVAPVPATLQGTVTDSATAAGLAGVRLQARRLDPTPRVRSAATTDAAGLYTLSDVGPGRYWVFFWRGGYRPQRRQVEQSPGSTTTLDIQLQPRWSPPGSAARTPTRPASQREGV